MYVLTSKFFIATYHLQKSLTLKIVRGGDNITSLSWLEGKIEGPGLDQKSRERGRLKKTLKENGM